MDFNYYDCVYPLSDDAPHQTALHVGEMVCAFKISGREIVKIHKPDAIFYIEQLSIILKLSTIIGMKSSSIRLTLGQNKKYVWFPETRNTLGFLYRP